MRMLEILRKVLSFRKKNVTDRKEATDKFPKEYTDVLSFNRALRELLSKDQYIARSDYRHLLDYFLDLYKFYNTLCTSGLLNEYVKKYRLEVQEIAYFRDIYDALADLKTEASVVRMHNDEFISRHLEIEKDYLDNILRTCDLNILLDDEQREVVLSDEDYTLVIAGAGAGKTTTVAAKVKYLVERRGIDARKILVISFTNKAVGELRERINDRLHINCPISTFHSAGYAILRKSDVARQKIVDGGFMYVVIKDYLKSKVLTNATLVKKLVLFFGSYFSVPYEGDDVNSYFQFVSKTDFSTLRSNVQEYIQQIIDRKTHKVQTLNNEVLRSIEEVRIANFLYLNSIEYEYEPVYQYRVLDTNKPYTPDFRIKQGEKVTYIEHFGITEDGQNSRYT